MWVGSLSDIKVGVAAVILAVEGRATGGEGDERPGAEPGLDDDHGVEGSVLLSLLAGTFHGGHHLEVVLDPGHHLPLRGRHAGEGEEAGAAEGEAAVVLVDGEEAEVLHLLVGLHVLHLRPGPDHAPAVGRGGGDDEAGEEEDEEEKTAIERSHGEKTRQGKEGNGDEGGGGKRETYIGA